MTTRRTYVTTPLFYVNAEPHLGHTYTMVVVDTLARLARQRGDETFFLTGTDEHGDKIAEAAAGENMPPKEYADRISATFRSTWERLGLSYDHFIRTTDPSHASFVKEILTRVHERGDIYFDEYGGLYCTGCERFYMEKELVDGLCPDHKTKPKYVAEENYFFRMSRYQEQLLAHIEANPDWIRPERFRNEVLGFLREPLEDLCISRPKSRLTWGIELPFDDRFVTYVWFDALLNYASALQSKGQDTFDRFWPVAEHVIAKDILKPHGIYWPTMLMAAGLPLYAHLDVHGYWTVEGEKMSKSLGNVVTPDAMRERVGNDGFRYFLLRESVFGLDGDFREESLIQRYNADLANNYGNLVSRALSMIGKYCDGIVPALGEMTEEDRALAQAFETAAVDIQDRIAELAFGRALEALFRATDHANKYITDTVPFRLAKDPEARPRLESILRNLAEAIYRTAHLAAPFLPETSEKTFELLASAPPAAGQPPAAWGTTFPEGHRFEKPVPLFPRLEVEAS